MRVALAYRLPLVAMLALFVALSGTAVATTSALVTGAQIKNSSITGADVKNKSLGPADFKGSLKALAAYPVRQAHPEPRVTKATRETRATRGSGDARDEAMGCRELRWFAASQFRCLVRHEAPGDHRLLLRRLQKRCQRLCVDGDPVELQRDRSYGRDHDVRLSVRERRARTRRNTGKRRSGCEQAVCHVGLLLATLHEPRPIHSSPPS